MGKVKEFAKKIPFARLLYKNTIDIVSNTCHHIFPVASTKRQYKKIFGRKLDLKHPETLNEKMIYLKFNTYWDNPLITKCVDKYLVRDYIEEKDCPELLNTLLGIWDDADKIEWDKLPDKFVLKCNHGSGFNILCRDKSKLDKKSTVKQLNKWLKITYGYGAVEQGIYRNVKPLIIAEQFIDTSDGLPPKDYKLFCSYGKVKLLFVASERVNDRTKFDYYYPDWTWIPVKNAHPNAGPIPKPELLEKLIMYAEKLSKDFPLVRVDFYEEAGKIIFGELTFTHFGCIHKFDPDKYDYEFGKLFPLKIKE